MAATSRPISARQKEELLPGHRVQCSAVRRNITWSHLLIREKLAIKDDTRRVAYYELATVSIVKKSRKKREES
jgi:hypothetical protein